jgi:putative flavoprotein involved in K+ transport
VTSTVDTFDAIVVGGGQAGLAMGYHLRRLGLDFVVLDAGSEVGETWRTRWDSLVLFTPAQYSSLPGMAFPAERDTYPTKDDVADYLHSYATAFELPVHLGSRVTSLAKDNGTYVARTGSQDYRAQHVIVATGPFQVPVVPAISSDVDDDVVQVHSSTYRRPEQLPEGRTLVVGGGNSGFQIAEELATSRTVDLAIGTKAVRLPQRFLGRDLFWWLDKIGIYRAASDSRLGRRLQARPDPVIGSSIRRLRDIGVTFRGRCTRARGRRIGFEDGSECEYDAIVWATGFRTDHSWLQVPGVFNEQGGIVHRRGVSPLPGLYFLGLSWLHSRGSALLGWVGTDAAHLSEQISVLRR